MNKRQALATVLRLCNAEKIRLDRLLSLHPNSVVIQADVLEIDQLNAWATQWINELNGEEYGNEDSHHNG